MERSQRARRGAAVGLAVVLLALTAVSIVGAASTHGSAATVSRSVALANAYDRADDAVAAEESLERKYRLEPGPEIRDRHRAASAALQNALIDIYNQGDGSDRELVVTLRELHTVYLAGIHRMFVAVDAGDTDLVLRIDSEQVDPRFDRISDLVQDANAAHARVAARAVQRLHQVEGLVFATTIAAFAVGLALIAVFTLVAVGYQRTLLRQSEASRYQALHDPLTGLPNRTLFTDRLTRAMSAARHRGGGVAVMLLNLDRFKEVNATLGHRYGDELLRQVAARATATLHTGDTVARLSADEFAVLLPDTTVADSSVLADRLLAALHRSFTLRDVTVDVEVSLGLAVAPRHAETGDALLRCADVAMYAAKDTKSGVVVYQSDMHTEDAGRLQLLGDLRRALDTDDQLVLHYQPKVSLRFSELCGVEALLRWQHPTRGMIAPAEFIPMAETTGLINRLTLYVLRRAVAQARDWLDDGLTIPVAVNLSPRCLLDPHLVQQVTDLLHEYQLPADLLRLEVTETAVMINPALAKDILHRLHDLGVRLSIDDYGIGYSSMAYLKRLPVDELKVDRTFVRHMDTDHDDIVLVRGAIDLGHNLGLTVVAEGVEDSTHVTALRALSCDIAQGYHYARPMPPEELVTWLQAHSVTSGTGHP